MEHAEAFLSQALAAAETIYLTPAENPYPPEALALLCELAAATDEKRVRAGVIGLFTALVERLNDSFAPAACARYDQVFTEVIEFFRRLPQGSQLDAGLRRFGLLNAADLLARKRQLGSNCKFTEAASIKKILLLSRVTIGADVAVTGVLLAALQQRFPQAEFVWLGSAKLRELWGGHPRVRMRELPYERSGTVLARLQSWLAVAAAIADETQNSDYLVLDPDSRLTQLGLLPVTANDRNYFFFESRCYGAETHLPLGALAARWCRQVFDTPAEFYPQLALPAAHVTLGQTVAQGLRRAGQRHLVSLSFGVGGNQRKRLSDEFESELLRHLLEGSALLLDKGGTAEERAPINRLGAELRAQGRTVVELDAGNLNERLAECGTAAVITWDGSIGAFAGLIAASDQYVGYDSAGQHIAAALGVPALTIFVNSNTPLFAARWRPYGKGPIETINLTLEQANNWQAVLQQTLAAAQRLRQTISRSRPQAGQ